MHIKYYIILVKRKNNLFRIIVEYEYTSVTFRKRNDCQVNLEWDIVRANNISALHMEAA